MQRHKSNKTSKRISHVALHDHQLVSLTSPLMIVRLTDFLAINNNHTPSYSSLTFQDIFGNDIPILSGQQKPSLSRTQAKLFFPFEPVAFEVFPHSRLRILTARGLAFSEPSRGDGDVIFTKSSLPGTGQGRANAKSHISKHEHTWDRESWQVKCESPLWSLHDGDKVVCCSQRLDKPRNREGPRRTLYTPLWWYWILGFR